MQRRSSLYCIAWRPWRVHTILYETAVSVLITKAPPLQRGDAACVRAPLCASSPRGPHAACCRRCVECGGGVRAGALLELGAQLFEGFVQPRRERVHLLSGDADRAREGQVRGWIVVHMRPITCELDPPEGLLLDARHHPRARHGAREEHRPQRAELRPRRRDPTGVPRGAGLLPLEGAERQAHRDSVSGGDEKTLAVFDSHRPYLVSEVLHDL
mmetsp:Transcript_61011/g.144648  ORF Transcript_61011/g.144648 Transcript_61011/m.144648 type:complete len:214 (-) Transcript_61011:785-1426(-)